MEEFSSSVTQPISLTIPSHSLVIMGLYWENSWNYTPWSASFPYEFVRGFFYLFFCLVFSSSALFRIRVACPYQWVGRDVTDTTIRSVISGFRGPSSGRFDRTIRNVNFRFRGPLSSGFLACESGGLDSLQHLPLLVSPPVGARYANQLDRFFGIFPDDCTWFFEETSHRWSPIDYCVFRFYTV